MTETTVEDLVRNGRIERVRPDREAASVELEMARHHLEAVEKIAAFDPVLAYVGVYDGVRKAISAHMRAHGFRPRGITEKHRKTFEYAVAALARPDLVHDLAELDRMRSLRHRSEYEAMPIGVQQVRDDLSRAQRIVAAVATDLAR